MQLYESVNCSNAVHKLMNFNILHFSSKHMFSIGVMILAVALPHLLRSQCATFGAFDIGEDAEITCEDSCLTLVSPSIATVASGGTEYEVEEIEYALPYPFNQGSVAINTGDDVYSSIIPLGFTFEFFGNNYNQCRISSNGWFSFDLTETAGYNPNGTNPNQNLPNNLSLIHI